MKILDKNDLANFVVENCITWSKKDLGKDVMYGRAPGARYTYIVQMGSLLMNYEAMRSVAFYLNQMLHMKYCVNKYQLTGGEPNSLPIITAINAYRTKLGLEPYHAFWVRNERKNYGPYNVFEGKPDPVKKVVMLYDMANSTEVFAKCYNVCVTNKLEVVQACYAILNKNNHYLESPYVDQISGFQIESVLEWNDVRGLFRQ